MTRPGANRTLEDRARFGLGSDSNDGSDIELSAEGVVENTDIDIAAVAGSAVTIDTTSVFGTGNDVQEVLEAITAEFTTPTHVHSGGGGFTVIVKPVDTARDTLDVPANDPHLLFAADASSLYIVKLNLIYGNNANATPDWEWDIGLPAGASVLASDLPQAQGTNATLFTPPVGVAMGSSGAGANFLWMSYFLRVTIGVTAGNVAFKWSQNVSDASNPVTLRAGSYLEYKKA